MSRQILIIKTSSLGDVVHNLPAVTDMRRYVPATEIDWVVEEAFAEVPALHPGVREVIPVALRRWRRGLHRPAVWRELRAFLRRLRARRYDAVLDTQGLVKSAFLAWVACGPTYGQDRKTAREGLAALFYDRVYHIARGRHAVVRNRELAARALGYAIPQTPPDYGLEAPGPSLFLTFPSEGGGSLFEGTYVVCLHGTSRESKRWPLRHWVDLATGLLRAGIVPLLPWGNESERLQAEEIARAAAGARVLPQRFRLRELAAVMVRARAVVGVDTGLVHLAAALGCPTVALYTDSSPRLTGVLAADERLTVNLGERGQMPSPEEVWQGLAGLGIC